MFRFVSRNSRSFLVLEIIVSLEKFEKLFNFVVLLAFLDEISHCDLTILWEKLFYELLYFLIDDLVGNAEHLETCADRAINQKLKLDQLEPFHFIKVEYVKQNSIKMFIHLILSSSLVSEKMARPEKSSRESMRPLLSVSHTTKEDSPVSKMC